ncbi:uncharacterized protein TNCV_1659231 [Trichonephila clavipes]|nr:uncharacterized protein TNCV_1659231 [Trichonephila clavipes]
MFSWVRVLIPLETLYMEELNAKSVKVQNPYIGVEWNFEKWVASSVLSFVTNNPAAENTLSASTNVGVAAVAEWYRYRIVACFVTGSNPVPLKTRRVGQRCTLNLSRAETSSRWCGVVVRRGGASSGVVHVT